MIVYIESLITIDGFNPSMFHGYKHLEMMIHESVGNIKMNYLLALMNIVRQIIPPDITTTPVHVIEPTIPKNSNPRDA